MIEIELSLIVDFVMILIFSVFGILFALEKDKKPFFFAHIIIVALFSCSISLGLSYFIYIAYKIELDNRVIFTLSSIVGFGFEYFTIKQVLEGIKLLKTIKVSFTVKNNKKGGK